MTIVNDAGSDNLKANKTAIVKLTRDAGGSAGRAFHGDLAVRYDDVTGWQTDDNTCYVRCYADSGILSFRGSCQAYGKVSNLELRCDQVTNESGVGEYKAGFGILFPHSRTTQVYIENILVSRCRWVFGQLENSSVNAEFYRVERVNGTDCYGFLYHNAGQALDQVFDKCHHSLGAPREPADGDTHVFAEIGGGLVQGTSLSFTDCGSSPIHTAPKDTVDLNVRTVLVRLRGDRAVPLGVLRFESGRYEHVQTVVEWATKSDALRTLTILFHGMHFDGMMGGLAHGSVPKRPFIAELTDYEEALTPDQISQYTLGFSDCTFDIETPTGTRAGQILLIEGHPSSRSSVLFARCRFGNWAGRKIDAPNVRFTDCVWRDPDGKTLRVFREGFLAMTRAGSADDMPRAVPCGPALQLLVRSGSPAADNLYSAGEGWSLKALTTDVDFKAFQKFGRTSHNDDLALTQPTEEAFAMTLGYTTILGVKVPDILTQQITRLYLVGVYVYTYEAVVRVTAGRMEFALTDGASASAAIFDSIVVTQNDEASFRHISLTANLMPPGVGDDEPVAPFLRIRSVVDSSKEDNTSTAHVMWQAAYQGTGPFSPILTSPDVVPWSSSDVPGDDSHFLASPQPFWSHVFAEVRVTGRLLLPFRSPGAGYAYRNELNKPVLPGAGNVEVYFDSVLGCLMAWRGGAWFVLNDDSRWRLDIDQNFEWDATDPDHNMRLLQFIPTADRTLTLDSAGAPNGKHVTVFHDGSGHTVTVKRDDTTVLATLSAKGRAVFVCRQTTSGGVPNDSVWLLESQGVQANVP